MPALESITIQGFKSIDSIEKLELRNLNVLIGANGSGKSNFLGALAFLQAVRDGRLQSSVARVGGANRLLHFGRKVTPELSFAVTLDAGGSNRNIYRLYLIPSDDDGLRVHQEFADFWDKSRYGFPLERRIFGIGNGSEAGISFSSSSSQTIESYVNSKLHGLRTYHVHDTGESSPLKLTADVHDTHFLRGDGANFSAFLYRLKRFQPAKLAEIEGAIQRIAPFFNGFQLAPRPENPDKIRLEWQHRGTDAYFDAASLSDGTLRFMFLATLLLQPADLAPSVTIIDEPELGLHPTAIVYLAELVKRASLTRQIILATQSSHLLDHFAPEDVLVAEREKEGTTLRRLEPEPLKAWLEDYSLGQLWEKNHFGGRPDSA